MTATVLPLLLAPNNFTPRARTPWAGQDIYARYKKCVTTETSIGESWEVSCDPDFPSQILDASSGKPTGQTLQEAISADPEALISPRLARELGSDASCPLLVKLVNAASPLSVQIHPGDNFPELTPTECGKPESWLILHANPGCGIYIGLRRPWTAAALHSALGSGKFSGDDMYFIPVQEGDYFDLAPGILHAIGPGVTILEPQLIKFGKSGKTYRAWDWNRRYDARGMEDSVNGKARDLHVEQALKLFDPTLQHGPEFAGTTMRTATRSQPSAGVNVQIYPPNENYAVRRIQMLPGAAARLEIAAGQGFATVTVLSGNLTIGRKSGEAGVKIPTGYSAFIPWAGLPCALDTSLGADFALITHAALDIAVAR